MASEEQQEQPQQKVTKSVTQKNQDLFVTIGDEKQQKLVNLINLKGLDGILALRGHTETFHLKTLKPIYFFEMLDFKFLKSQTDKFV